MGGDAKLYQNHLVADHDVFRSHLSFLIELVRTDTGLTYARILRSDNPDPRYAFIVTESLPVSIEVNATKDQGTVVQAFRMREVKLSD